jgi:hypothetical protein
MADPFEEFEFKPLTEGLGFQKKAETLKNEIQSTLVSTNSVTNSVTNSAATAFAREMPARSMIFPESPKNTDRAATKSFGTSAGSAAASFGSMASGTDILRNSSETSRTASQSISDLMASLPPSLDFLDDKQDLTRKSEMPFGTSTLATPATPSIRPQIFQPLGQTLGQSTGHEDHKSTSHISQGPTVGSVLPAPGTKAGSLVSASAAIAAPLKATSASSIAGASMNSRAGYSNRMVETFGKAFPKSETKSERKLAKKSETNVALAEGLAPVAVNFSAALIDAMVVAGVATILLVCIITITHINLVGMLSNAATDGSTQKNLVFLFFAVLQMYMLIARAFFGATLGEWAFELQMGTNEQSGKLYYPVLVLWRVLFVMITGVFTVPLLSFAFGRDLASYVTGLQLYRRA